MRAAVGIRAVDRPACSLVTVMTTIPWKTMQYEHLHMRRLVSNYQLNAQFLYSITIYMLHYNPRHVSSSTMLIFKRTNCVITASGVVTLCKRPYSMPVESGMQSALNRHTVRHCALSW